MKKTITFIIQVLFVGITCSCEKNCDCEGKSVTNFSDDTFYAWCLNSFDLDGDNELSLRELYIVSEMDIPAEYNGQPIRSLEGIENFILLEQLTCTNNPELTSLDLHKCSYLKKIDCYNCNISSLNIKGCILLEELYCYSNSLEKLDLLEFNNLITLYCDFNHLTSLDFTNCPNLQTVSCAGNSLKGDLDLSKCIELESFLCEKNSIESIDITSCKSLKTLNIHSNKIATLDIYSTVLESLSCSDNDLTWLYVGDCNKLYELNCQNNPSMSQLGIKGCSTLRILNCHSNNLFSLNASDCTSLETIDCHNNNLSSVYFNSPKIKYLDISNNKVQTLDISASPNIKELYYSPNNSLTTIYINANIDIINLINSMGENIDLGGGDKTLLQHK